MSLEQRVKAHRWTSVEVIDVMERIELCNELRALPLKQLAEVLKTLDPKVSREISILIEILG